MRVANAERFAIGAGRTRHLAGRTGTAHLLKPLAVDRRRAQPESREIAVGRWHRAVRRRAHHQFDKRVGVAAVDAGRLAARSILYERAARRRARDDIVDKRARRARVADADWPLAAGATRSERDLRRLVVRVEREDTALVRQRGVDGRGRPAERRERDGAHLERVAGDANRRRWRRRIDCRARLAGRRRRGWRRKLVHRVAGIDLDNRHLDWLLFHRPQPLKRVAHRAFNLCARGDPYRRARLGSHESTETECEQSLAIERRSISCE